MPLNPGSLVTREPLGAALTWAKLRIMNKSEIKLVRLFISKKLQKVCLLFLVKKKKKKVKNGEEMEKL